jgi:hypothetical protein
MSTATNFWGNVAAVDLRTPLSIMREQASLLGTMTQNLVEARVDTRVSTIEGFPPFFDPNFEAFGERQFVHIFKLVVPALDSYTYDLFTARHGADLYPVRVEDKLYKSEGEFEAWFRAKLSAPGTTHLIQKLLAQARS